MGFPAARVLDTHTCPFTTGIVPHVGGPILPLGVLSVWIGGLPAAVVGNMCFCVGPPDSIVKGSMGVFIGGMPAARVLDQTIHGGMISLVGPHKVLIGDLIFAMARAAFPGAQSYNNCGVQSSQQVINLMTGVNRTEDDLLQESIDAGLAENATNPIDRGGTLPNGRQQILQNNGVASTVISNPTADDISNGIRNHQVMIANADVSVLWAPTTQSGGHAITVYDGDYDERGNLTHVYINDTGTGQQGRAVPVDTFMDAMNARPNPSLNVPTDPAY